MDIRVEQAGDAAAIAALIRAAFTNGDHDGGAEEAIVAALRADDALALSLVAAVEGGIAGHIAFSAVTIDGHDRGWLGLAPLAVRPDLQRRGIGTALVETGLALLAQGGAGGCVVLGDPDFYGRFGFRADSRLALPGVPAWAFQSLAWGGDMPSGVVAYHPALGAAEPH